MSMRSMALASLLGCLLLPACADQQESLIVLRAPAWGGEECIVDASSDVGLIEGVLDVTQGTAYLLPLTVLNNLQTQSTDSSNAGIITNEIQLKSADVDLSSDDAEALVTALGEGLTSFSVILASDSVAPGESIGVAVEAISRATSQGLLTAMETQWPTQPDVQIRVQAAVVVHGTRTGNTVGKIGQIDAREFTFPIRVCRGCLLDCTGCDEMTDDAGNVLSEEGVCPPTEKGVFVGGICGNAQDFAYAPPDCNVGAP